MASVLINGFGRVGRAVFRLLLRQRGVDVVRINDPLPAPQLAYLLKYDSVMGRLDKAVEIDGQSLVVGGRRVALSHVETLTKAEVRGCGLVVNSSGRNNSRKNLERILKLGARRVVVSKPLPKDVCDRTILRGVNVGDLRRTDRIISAGSCTAHCFTPLVKLIHQRWPVLAGYMLTVHAYTSAQNIVDGGHASDPRRGRAAATNIVPTTTESLVAFNQVMPELAGRIEGMAQRVPVLNGSNIELVLQLQGQTSAVEINDVIAEAANSSLAGIVEYCTDPLVSSDIVGNPHSAIFDSPLTHVVASPRVTRAGRSTPTLARLVAWYDNEWGYANRLAELLSLL